MNTLYLKLIALITMIIDHTGAVFYPEYPVLRLIGRIAFPIYCFLLVEGYFHTRDVKKYALRLLAFAFISEIPFDLAFFGRIEYTHQNIFFTLFLGLLAVHFTETSPQNNPIPGMAAILAAIVLSEFLRTDYGILGILYIMVFYGMRQVKSMMKILFMILLLTLLNFLLSGGLQLYSILAVLFIAGYNGKPGPRSAFLKYGFYAAYPVHLLVIYLLK